MLHSSMPSTKPCKVSGCAQTANTAGLCATHHYRAKTSPDGEPYDVQSTCLGCGESFNKKRRFCDKCVRDISKEDRASIYKRYHYKTNPEKYAAWKAGSPVPPEKAKLYNIKYTYGVSAAEYKLLEERTGGVCPICLRDPVETFNRNKWMVIDHNHATGQMRGLLCHSCNIALGSFQDDQERLRRAIEYLQRPERWWIDD